MTNCRNCNEPIDFKDKKDGSGKYPVNTNGTFHNCRAREAEAGKKFQSEGREKRTRWEGIKAIREIKYKEVGEYLVNGWVILDRVERMIFVEVPLSITSEGTTKTLQQTTESIYIVGQRA